MNGDAFLIAEATVENHTAADFCGWVDFSVKDSAGRGKIRAYVPAGQTTTCRTQLCIEGARLWDIDSPNLYEVNAALPKTIPSPISQAVFSPERATAPL